MIYFLIGIIIGLLLAICFFCGGLYFKPKTDRIIRQTVSKLSKKGEIIDPESETLENWIKNLPDERAST